MVRCVTVACFPIVVRPFRNLHIAIAFVELLRDVEWCVGAPEIVPKEEGLTRIPVLVNQSDRVVCKKIGNGSLNRA